MHAGFNQSDHYHLQKPQLCFGNCQPLGCLPADSLSLVKTGQKTVCSGLPLAWGQTSLHQAKNHPQEDYFGVGNQNLVAAKTVSLGSQKITLQVIPASFLPDNPPPAVKERPSQTPNQLSSAKIPKRSLYAAN